MRCNPWRWLWGLIPVAMLSWIALHWERGNIEADLTRRTQDSLVSQGLDWAVTRFEGRDGVLRGRASAEDEPKRALDAVSRTWGVRVVDAQTELMPKADRFTWLASLNKGKLTLSGFVPSEAARGSVLSVAKANFPKLEIEDTMKLARGAPAQESWVGASSFALRQLAQLKRGAADLDGLTFSIAGEAKDAAAYKGVQAALAKLPKETKLGASNISPALVSPFVWNAKRSNDKVVISGHVPSDKVREELFGRARRQFDKIPVVDRMEIAGGAPDGWAKVAGIAIDQLALVEDGMAETNGAACMLAGRAADLAAVEAIRNALRSVPGTFKCTEKVTYPEPPAVDPEAQARAEREAEERRLAALDEEKRRAETEAAARREADEQANARRRSEEEAAARRAEDEAAARRRAEDEAAARRAEEEALARRKADEEAQRAAEAEARQRAWLDLELRWSGINEDYERRRREEEAQRAALLAREEERRVEADRCQTMMRDAAQRGRIQFKVNSSNLDPRSASTLNELAKIVEACPNARIEIEGHTDSDGDEGMNKTLSERRAKAIVDFLAEAGAPASRLAAIGYGESRPVAPNDSAANKAKNRRIDFKVVPN